MYTIKGNTGDWEIVIGLETHIEVHTHAKLFSGASADYNPSVPANTQVSFVDAAMPGMLPVLNTECVDQAIRFGLAINAEISPRSIFTRKQYFYPDLPSGYQITQPADEAPVVGRGSLTIMGDDGNPKTIQIERAHMEMDAGKNMHDKSPTKSMVDLNRAGVMLLEIVTYLDTKNPNPADYITSPDEAERYLRAIQEIVRATGVSNANMEEGSMRADVNVSVRRAGTKDLGTRCEIKNMVSFKFIKTAIEYEARRQIEIIESGGAVSQDTMRYNQDSGTTSVLRSKENALDYRHFPDPDLLPLIITPEHIEKIRKTMPEMPDAKRGRYQKDFELSEYDAEQLTSDMQTALFFDSVVDGDKARAKISANWILSEAAAKVMSAEFLREMIDMIIAGDISGKIAKDIGEKIIAGDTASPRKIVERDGLKQVSDTGAIEKIVDEVILNNPAQVAEYRGGKVGLIGFFVGQVMKSTGGTANPSIVNNIIKGKLS